MRRGPAGRSVGRQPGAPGVLRGLRVDLGSGGSAVVELAPEVRSAVLGGRGLGAWLLLEERAYALDALSPANPIVFAAGPLAGGGVPAASRYSISTRSPLTGTAFDGNSGGEFGDQLRRLGLDHLVVTGACETPVSLRVDRDGAHIESAADLWGLDVPATLAEIGKRYPGSQAAVIGPAGERGVLFASISTARGRQAGRGGVGAVMGAKGLKAVILDVGHGVGRPARTSEPLQRAIDDMTTALRTSKVTTRALPGYGTAVLMNLLNEAGVLPSCNFRRSQFAAAEAISGEAIRSRFSTRRGGCRRCPIGCSPRVPADGTTRGVPQYETLWALGADCGIGDLGAVVSAGHACDRAGLDTISMGGTIACAMELTESSVLRDGPRFGEAGALLDLIEATTERRGLGDELAEGSLRFAARHGRRDLAMQVKGLELPAFDPRGMTGQGLSFATSNRGGCHIRANMLGPEILGVPALIDRFATHGKAGVLVHLQDLNAALDSLVACKFAAFAVELEHFARLLSAVSGEAWGPGDLMRVGERVWTIEKTFNILAGFGRPDDSLPKRLLEEPVPDGPAAGRVVDLEPMLDEYCAVRGWSGDGRPSRQKLVELGLSLGDDEAHLSRAAK